MRKHPKRLIGIIGIGLFLLALLLILSLQYITQSDKPYEYKYNISANIVDNRQWQYIENENYKIVLNNGSSLSVNLKIDSKDPLDIVEIRFYHPCNNNKFFLWKEDMVIAEMYTYIDGVPAIPTIGKVNNSEPIYIPAPTCPKYGTVVTTIWDTDDTRHSGNITYKYLFKSLTPIYIKTIELYISSKR